MCSLQSVIRVIISQNPAGNYMFKVNDRNTRTGYEICSKLTMKTPGGYIVNLVIIHTLFLCFCC